MVSQSTISRLERGLAPHVAVYKLVMLSATLGARLPLAFCPHQHGCVWERLDARGVPSERMLAVPIETWFRMD